MMCFLFYFIQPFELKQLSTHDTGIKQWSYGFTVMRQSGDVAVSGREDKGYYGSGSLFVFSLKDGKLRDRKKISPSCGHNYVSSYTSALIIDGREKLVVSCYHCDDFKLLDLQTEEWSTAFTGCKPNALCSGDSGTLFIQSREDQTILELDCTSSVFKGPIKNLHPNMLCMAMCYIPPPVNALVLSDWYSSKMVAWSVERDAAIWEFKIKLKLTGLLFHPEHNVLLVADRKKKRVLIVDPEEGSLIQTIDLPDMGEINALGLDKDQIVMLHGNEGNHIKISYRNLSD